MSRRAKMWRRTVVGSSLAGGLTLMLLVAARPFGDVFVALVGALVATLAAFEARKMGALFDRRAVVVAVASSWAAALVVLGLRDGGWLELVYLQAVLLGRPSWIHSLYVGDVGSGQRYFVTAFCVLGVCALTELLGALQEGTGRPASRMLRTLWIAAPLHLLGLLRRDFGVEGLAAFLVLAKVGDVAGYFGGQMLAGPDASHPFPRLSPGKTTIGCACSLAVATGVGVLFTAVGWLHPGPLGLLSGALAGAILNLAAQAGDLLESAAKRAGSVKDSGTWFGPSGGVLDLVDSLLLGVPVAVLVWPLLLAFS